MMVPVTVARLGIDSASQSFVVVLHERDGERFLPIWIGQAEAESIAAHLQGVRRERPMTHDLIRNLLRTLQVTLLEVAVTRVEASTFFGELHLQQGEASFVEDARPSDAIAIAVRCDAPIVVAEHLLLIPSDDAAATDDAADELTEVDDDPSALLEPSTDPIIDAAAAPESPAEALQRYLARLRPEDFGKFRP